MKESAQKIAVVAQHNYYNFEFSVQDVVMMGRAPHKRALDRDTMQDFQIVHQALKTVGMEEFENRSFSTLSAVSSRESFWPEPCTTDAVSDLG